MSSLEQILNIPIIQGGMGLGVSGHKLAKEVSCYGQLGVISATAPDILLIRGLQNGDITGELREALKQFPNQQIANTIIDKFFIEGGRDPSENYRLNSFPQFQKTSHTEFRLTSEILEDSLVAGAFVEVYLAKKGHDNPVGANFLNKIGWGQLPTLYGAMLAGVNVVLIGAGFPRDIPDILTAFTTGSIGKMVIPVSDKKIDSPYHIVFDPQRFNASNLSRPLFLGIVGNHLGVRGLPNADGYVCEGVLAGGHNPPARSGELSEIGEPLFGLPDETNFELLRSVLQKRGGHQPYWLAGNYASRLIEAQSYGAQGIQVGTAFAFCTESGIAPELKLLALTEIMNGAKVFTDPLASPTEFPFKVLQASGTMAFEDVYLQRTRVCDLGYLVELYENDKGEIKTRCPAGPIEMYEKRGGDITNTIGRKCLCNSLTANIGLGKPNEKPLLTSGSNLDVVKELVQRYGMNYSAKNVIDLILEKR